MDAKKQKVILGKPCWTVIQAAAEIGVHRNTIIGWVKKSMQGALDCPYIRAPVRGSKIYLPIDEFRAWADHSQF